LFRHWQSEGTFVMDNIGRKPADVNLDELAALVCREIQAVRSNGATVLHHAMAAGDALNEAQEHVGRGWKHWLKENCRLSVRTALLYQRLARHRTEIEAEIERNIHLSLRAAVKFIAAPSPRSTNTRIPTPLSITAWRAATVEQRQTYLVAIGLAPFLEVIPPEWYGDLKRRVDGVADRTAAIDPLSGVIAKALRQALSHQKTAKDKDAPAVGIANALNAINNKLMAVGLDLNDIEVFVRRAPAKRRAA
jgi:hypothetical protein